MRTYWPGLLYKFTFRVSHFHLRHLWRNWRMARLIQDKLVGLFVAIILTNLAGGVIWLVNQKA